MATASRFEIERELGRGGAGTVWLARDHKRGGERVALKRLSGAGDPTALRREFELLLLLRHPVIVSVRDFGSDDQGSWLTMEFVDGQDLSGFAGKTDPERVARWALLLADALEHARRRGVVHGDLKPENILVPRGQPDSIRLLDLGFARLGGTGSVGGTPEYLAPEVLAGHAPDARSDLFGLGCVLYHALTGETPFAGLERRRMPAALPAAVPERLRHTIGLLLKLRPDERPGRPADLVLLLGDAPGLRLALPEGDLVGRERTLALVEGGGIVLLEAAPGMGASRLLREIGERAELTGSSPRIALYRPGQVPTPVGDTVVVERLMPLSQPEFERLIRSRLPLEDAAVRAVAVWLLEESGGNPALAIEALECLRDSTLLKPGPLGLSCEVERLSQLRPEAARTSRVHAWIAWLGNDQRREQVEAMMTVPAPANRPAAMFRRALEAEIETSELQALHSRAADALLATDGPAPGLLADHLVAGGRATEAGAWLLRAAEAALAAGVNPEAKRRLEQAVDLLPEREAAAARLLLSREQALAGEADAALVGFAAARAGDPELAAETHLGEARVYAARGQHANARLAAVEAVRRARKPDGAAVRAQALLLFGRLSAQRGHEQAAARHLESALCLFRSLGDSKSVARVALAQGNVASLAGRIDDAVEAYQRAREAASQAKDSRVEGLALEGLAILYANHRRSDVQARPALLAVLSLAEAGGDSASIARALAQLATLELDCGRGDEARRHVERAIQLRLDAGDNAGIIAERILLGEILTVGGRFAEAGIALEAALNGAVALGDRRREAAALEELGRHSLETANPGRARTYFEAALLRAQAAGEESIEAQSRAGLALALLENDDRGGAQRTLTAISRDFSNEPEALARITRARASLMIRENRAAEAVRLLERALRELGTAGFELEMARTLLILGVALGCGGHTEAALDALERARAVFDRHGAKPALARTLLAKANVKMGSSK